MENFGKFMAIILAMIISPIIYGFVFMKLWIWIIVPTFHVESLRLVEAIGILILINFTRAKLDKNFERDKFWENFAKNIIFVIVSAIFTLCAGWLLNLFI